MTAYANKVDQTILAGDPRRLGNCVSACVASYLGVPLHVIPHFVELGDRDAEGYGLGWWWALVGFMAAHGLCPVELDDADAAAPGEIVFASGPSPRGVEHQVLYRDGELWHDPHPSRGGVLGVTEVIAWRPKGHDHTPTPMCPVRGRSGRCLQPAGHLAEQVDHTYPPVAITEAQVGRCGDKSAGFQEGDQQLPSVFCNLPSGHPGWHRGDDSSEWSA